MIWTVETIQRAILQEARRRWSKTGEGHDKLAPSLAVSLLSESKWYVSLVRWPDRARKIVERRCEGDDLLKALVTIATGFVPSSHPSWLPAPGAMPKLCKPGRLVVGISTPLTPLDQLAVTVIFRNQDGISTILASGQTAKPGDFCLEIPLPENT